MFVHRELSLFDQRDDASQNALKEKVRPYRLLSLLPPDQVCVDAVHEGDSSWRLSHRHKLEEEN